VDKWGVIRTIPVIVQVGPQDMIIAVGDRNFMETGLSDIGDDVYVEVGSDGRIPLPATYWKNINGDIARLWPNPDNPGEFLR
jgi:hypothetical protein